MLVYEFLRQQDVMNAILEIDKQQNIIFTSPNIHWVGYFEYNGKYYISDHPSFKLNIPLIDIIFEEDSEI
jgi:hypothetical protein